MLINHNIYKHINNVNNFYYLRTIKELVITIICYIPNPMLYS